MALIITRDSALFSPAHVRVKKTHDRPVAYPQAENVLELSLALACVYARKCAASESDKQSSANWQQHPMSLRPCYPIVAQRSVTRIFSHTPAPQVRNVFFEFNYRTQLSAMQIAIRRLAVCRGSFFFFFFENNQVQRGSSVGRVQYAQGAPDDLFRKPSGSPSTDSLCAMRDSVVCTYR